GDARERAARDVPDRVALPADRRQPRRFDLRKDLGELIETNPVQLDPLAGRELGGVSTVGARDPAQGPELRGVHEAARNLDAHHEGADLGLVVGQAPPVQADDVLLGHRLVPSLDQPGKLVANVERKPFALQTLDRVAPEHQVPVRFRSWGCDAASAGHVPPPQIRWWKEACRGAAGLGWSPSGAEDAHARGGSSGGRPQAGRQPHRRAGIINPTSPAQRVRIMQTPSIGSKLQLQTLRGKAVRVKGPTLPQEPAPPGAIGALPRLPDRSPIGAWTSHQTSAKSLFDVVELDDLHVDDAADRFVSTAHQTGDPGTGLHEHAERSNGRHDGVDLVAGTKGHPCQAAHPLSHDSGEPQSGRGWRAPPYPLSSWRSPPRLPGSGSTPRRIQRRRRSTPLRSSVASR